MIFELVTDFAEVLDAMPADHPRSRILRLLNEAIRRDIHFIDRHASDYPQALFQCLWNSCWWHDSPEAAAHYRDDQSPGKDPIRPLSRLLEHWKSQKEQIAPGFAWLRSHRPPFIHLGMAQLAVFRGHAAAVQSVAFSPDGQRIASGSMDGTVRVWDADSGAEVAVSRGHAAAVQSVAFSPDGQRIASGSMDGTVRVWDADSGAEVGVSRGHAAAVRTLIPGSRWKEVELALFGGHEGAVQSVAFSPDGRRIVSRSYNIVHICDAQTGGELAVLHWTGRVLTTIAFRPYEWRTAAGSHHVEVWNPNGGAHKPVLAGPEDWWWGVAYSCAFSPNGRRVVGGLPRDLLICDADSGSQLAELRGHESDVNSVAFSPDGQRIVSGSNDQTVRVWNADSGSQLAELRGHESDVNSVAFSPDGQRIVSGSNDQTVRVWNTDSGTQLAELRGHESDVNSVAFSSDGQLIVSGSNDQTVRVWSTENGHQLAMLRGHEGSVYGVAFSADGQRLASGSADKTLRIWDASSYSMTGIVNELIGLVSVLIEILLSLFGGFEPEKPLAVLEDCDPVLGVVFSPDGRSIVSGSGTSVTIWSVSSGRYRNSLHGHEDIVMSVAISPNGRRIASGSFDQTVRVWDTDSGKQLAVLRGHELAVHRVAFSPDGRWIAGESVKEVRVWDAETHECVKVVEGCGDVAAIAAREEWQALSRGLETLVVEGATDRAVAWFPVALRFVSTHPNGSTWAGAPGGVLYIITLEGTP